MKKPDEILLAAATKTIIDGIDWRTHEKIQEINATYKFDSEQHQYVPVINIKMK